MKQIAFLLLIAAIIWGARSFYHEQPSSEEYERLTMELKATEGLLAEADRRIEQLRANAPSCPLGKAELVITDDPRIELRQEIEDLKLQIAELEEAER